MENYFKKITIHPIRTADVYSKNRKSLGNCDSIRENFKIRTNLLNIVGQLIFALFIWQQKEEGKIPSW